jgi:hypothetical protein
MGRDAGRSSLVAGRKNNPNRGIRRGCPLTSQTAFGGQLPYKGSLVRPVARFHHSLFEYNGRLLRATSHEPRPFPRAEGYSRRCHYSESVAAKRPKSEAACELRGRWPQNSMNDLRRTTYAWPSGPYLTQKSQKNFCFAIFIFLQLIVLKIY